MSNLEHLRKSAKRWLKELRSGDSAARERLLRAHPEAPAEPTLRDVQHALARERGFDGWIALKAVAEKEEPADGLPALWPRPTGAMPPRSPLCSTPSRRC